MTDRCSFIIVLTCFFILVECITSLSAVETRKCGRPRVPAKLAFGEHRSTGRSKRDVSVPSQLRITPHYTGNFTASDDAEAIKKHMVEYAINYFSGALQAKNPILGTYFVTRGCINETKVKAKGSDGIERFYCLEGCNPIENCYVDIPEEYLGACYEIVNGNPTITKPSGTGLQNTDVLLLVDFYPDDVCMEAYGWATVCVLEDELNRPELVYTNICPRSIQFGGPESRGLQDLLKHEIAHALGFSDITLAFWRDENGNPRTTRNATTDLPILGKTDEGIYIASSTTYRKIQRVWKSAKTEITMTWNSIVTPNMLKAAREHFGCPTLDGVDMENALDSFHYEERLSVTELMGNSGNEGYISAITLAMFQDTGWYYVDMSKAEPFTWGKNLGCTFVQQSCYAYMQQQEALGQSIYPWCKEFKSKEYRCSSYANGYGNCRLYKNAEDLPEEYQYFTHIKGVPDSEVAKYGGDFVMKYCPYVRVQSHCSLPLEYFQTDEFDLREEHGLNSMCFDHGGDNPWVTKDCRWTTRLYNKRASCYKFECSEKTGLVVSIAGNKLKCPLQGGTINLNLLQFIHGDLVCPPCSSACKNCPNEVDCELLST